ncbi:hypothetical protein KIW84_022200 [Lathyrus oleraceus]|uniref:Uncharacterized protein n=1 Tax=Pisum sativum TaxID=3888 RepID=A0A9D5BAV8_PEA|nr:hypothetical protein KIW84_022200 [Pisum sativum]
MNSSDEDIRRKTIEENQKKMQALNLTKISQSLYKSSSSSSKPSSVKDDTENVAVGDETEDVVVEDGAEDVVRVTSSEYWDVNVINEEGYVSNTRLCVKDLVAKSEPGGTWIILEWDKTHRAVGPATGLLAGYLGIIIRMFKDFTVMFESLRDIPVDRKTKFYDSKIKRHFVADDGHDKDYILASAAKKWKDGRCQLFQRFYRWDLTLEENLQNYPKCKGITENDWVIFVQYRRKEKTQAILVFYLNQEMDDHTVEEKCMQFLIEKSNGSLVNEDAYNNNGLESPAGGRCSSKSSYRIADNGSSRRTN